MSYLRQSSRRLSDPLGLDNAEGIRFIVSTNIRRRHLTESQRAMIASELAKLGDGQRAMEQGAGAQIQAPAMTQAQAADMMQVSRSSVQAARQVQENAPDLAEKVKSGEIKVSKAASMARERIALQTDRPHRTRRPLGEY